MVGRIRRLMKKIVLLAVVITGSAVAASPDLKETELMTAYPAKREFGAYPENVFWGKWLGDSRCGNGLVLVGPRQTGNVSVCMKGKANSVQQVLIMTETLKTNKAAAWNWISGVIDLPYAAPYKDDLRKWMRASFDQLDPKKVFVKKFGNLTYRMSVYGIDEVYQYCVQFDLKEATGDQIICKVYDE